VFVWAVNRDSEVSYLRLRQGLAVSGEGTDTRTDRPTKNTKTKEVSDGL
jgi:hypothetical protein